VWRSKMENIISLDPFDYELPPLYTGIAIFRGSRKCYYKGGKIHREDREAVIYYSVNRQEWWLEGKRIWSSDIPITNHKIFEKKQHLVYPEVQIWKYIDNNLVKEQVVIPGMNYWFIE